MKDDLINRSVKERGIVSLVVRSLLLLITLALISMVFIIVGKHHPPSPQIAFQSNRGRDWDVYLIDVLRQLDVRMTFERSFDYAPAWSPDGSRVAFVSSRSGFYDIYMLDIARHQLYPVTDNLAAETHPVWVDAQTIRYRVMGEVETGDYLYQLDLLSGERVFLGSDSPYPSAPIPSPDARRMAEVKIERGNLDIAIWDVMTTAQGRIAAHTTNENYPSWSSDSQWLAFASDRDGNWEIYIASLDGRHVHRVTHNPHQDILPSWRPLG